MSKPASEEPPVVWGRPSPGLQRDYNLYPVFLPNWGVCSHLTFFKYNNFRPAIPQTPRKCVRLLLFHCISRRIHPLSHLLKPPREQWPPSSSGTHHPKPYCVGPCVQVEGNLGRGEVLQCILLCLVRRGRRFRSPRCLLLVCPHGAVIRRFHLRHFVQNHFQLLLYLPHFRLRDHIACLEGASSR
jgi:hypothetical protein